MKLTVFSHLFSLQHLQERKRKTPAKWEHKVPHRRRGLRLMDKCHGPKPRPCPLQKRRWGSRLRLFSQILSPSMSRVRNISHQLSVKHASTVEMFQNVTFMLCLQWVPLFVSLEFILLVCVLRYFHVDLSLKSVKLELICLYLNLSIACMITTYRLFWMHNHMNRSNMNVSECINSSHINSSVISFYLFDLWKSSVWAFSLPADAKIQLCITMNT